MDNQSLQPVTPVNPAAPYIGGKRILSKIIIQRINQTPHEAYAEPFVGMGGVVIWKRRTSRNCG
jgi:DNA adenine methylase